MKSNKLFLALFVQLAFLWSCGERKGSAIVPVKKDKPSESTPDNANLGEAQQQVGLGPCTRQTPRNCVPVDFGYSLVGTLGPMQGNNPGFIGEPKQPVHWQINVASKGDLTRELGVYKSGMDFYGYAVRYDSAGAIQQPQQINGSVQQISGMANTYSNIKIDWANPPFRGKMVLVVRDITLCRARSKPGMEALCTEFNGPNELFERNIEIPFKVAKNIISESQKRKHLGTARSLYGFRFWRNCWSRSF
ncbi:MAG: hypothetical protein R3B45_12145 [Bdellovibrionota bacterium]